MNLKNWRRLKGRPWCHVRSFLSNLSDKGSGYENSISTCKVKAVYIDHLQILQWQKPHAMGTLHWDCAFTSEFEVVVLKFMVS